MTWNVGDVYKARSGEILEVCEFTKTECCFRLRGPRTMEQTDYWLNGPLENLRGWAADLELEKIDLKTYIPTGLLE